MEISATVWADGLPIFAYRYNNQYLRAYKCYDSSCSSWDSRSLDTNTTSVWYFTDIAIGSDNLPIISYHNNSTEALHIYKCDTESCSAGSKTYQGGSNTGDNNSIAIGSDGFPIISYIRKGANDLEVYKCSNHSCSEGDVYVLDSENSVWHMNSIAIWDDGYPVISYLDQTIQALKVYKCSNDSCSAGTAYTLESDSINSSKIAIGANGYPLIVYGTGANRTKVYSCSDDSCSTGSSHYLGNVNAYKFDLVVDNNGSPLISYRDTANWSLNIYKCSDAQCSAGNSYILDWTGNSWVYNSITIIDSTNTPLIAYQGESGYLYFTEVGKNSLAKKITSNEILTNTYCENESKIACCK